MDIQLSFFLVLYYLAHLSRGIPKEASRQPSLAIIGKCYSGERFLHIRTLAYNTCSISTCNKTCSRASLLTQLLSIGRPNQGNSQRNVLPFHRVKWVALAHSQLLKYLPQNVLVLEWHRSL
jgi:hypothetical protein